MIERPSRGELASLYDDPFSASILRFVIFFVVRCADRADEVLDVVRPETTMLKSNSVAVELLRSMASAGRLFSDPARRAEYYLPGFLPEDCGLDIACIAQTYDNVTNATNYSDYVSRRAEWRSQLDDGTDPESYRMFTQLFPFWPDVADAHRLSEDADIDELSLFFIEGLLRCFVPETEMRTRWFSPHYHPVFGTMNWIIGNNDADAAHLVWSLFAQLTSPRELSGIAEMAQRTSYDSYAYLRRALGLDGVDIIGVVNAFNELKCFSTRAKALRKLLGESFILPEMYAKLLCLLPTKTEYASIARAPYESYVGLQDEMQESLEFRRRRSFSESLPRCTSCGSICGDLRDPANGRNTMSFCWYCGKNLLLADDDEPAGPVRRILSHDEEGA